MQVELKKKLVNVRIYSFASKNRPEKVWAKLAGSYETFKFSLFTGSLKNCSTILQCLLFQKRGCPLLQNVTCLSQSSFLFCWSNSQVLVF